MWLEIRKAIYGLPQAGILANKQLQEKPQPHGYYEVAHTPELWRHVARQVQFSLVVDDFGVKYLEKKTCATPHKCDQSRRIQTVDRLRRCKILRYNLSLELCTANPDNLDAGVRTKNAGEIQT